MHGRSVHPMITSEQVMANWNYIMESTGQYKEYNYKREDAYYRLMVFLKKFREIHYDLLHVNLIMVN